MGLPIHPSGPCCCRPGVLGGPELDLCRRVAARPRRRADTQAAGLAMRSASPPRAFWCPRTSSQRRGRLPLDAALRGGGRFRRRPASRCLSSAARREGLAPEGATRRRRALRALRRASAARPRQHAGAGVRGPRRDHPRAKNSTEWWGGMIFTLFFFALCWLWRADRFEMRPSSRSSRIARPRQAPALRGRTSAPPTSTLNNDDLPPRPAPPSRPPLRVDSGSSVPARIIDAGR